MYGVDVNFVVNLIVKSPRKFVSTTGDISYVRDNIHGIEWHHGYTSFADFIKILRDVCWGAAPVFVKGKERVKYIEKIVFNYQIPIIDLDLVGCPQYRENVYPNKPSCYYIFHWDVTRNSGKHFSCALEKSWFYTTWIRKAKLLETLSNIVTANSMSASKVRRTDVIDKSEEDNDFSNASSELDFTRIRFADETITTTITTSTTMENRPQSKGLIMEMENLNHDEPSLFEWK